MNLHSIELAYVAWLEGESVGVDVLPGMNSSAPPTASQHIVCYADTDEHVVGDLHKSNLRIQIITPPHSDSGNDESVALTAHSTLTDTVSSLVKSYATGTLEATFNAETAYTFSGIWRGSDDAGVTDGGDWVTTINLTCGVRTIPS